ncbi:MAG: cytochrome c3 family protein [Planctomycetota bacterium]
MNLKARSIVVGVVSAVLVLTLTMAAAERQSPGPISTVHGRLAELDGGASCSSCHGGWFGDMRASCIECHEEIAAQLEHGNGLHGVLGKEAAHQCATCHSEHHGETFQQVNRLAFAQAGVPDPEAFDHRMIGFDLSGAHDQLKCDACHEHAYAEVLPENQQRFLGLQRDCGSCHANPHGGRMQMTCVTCHTQSDFTQRFVSKHDRWLRLEGAHGGVDCRSCHQAGSAHALEALRPGELSARGCADCHESPHVAAFVAGNGGCASCHQQEFEHFDDDRLALTAEQHAHSGFALGAPHDRLACTACHDAAGTFAERHPGRAPTDCRACHQDPHGGQFDGSPLAEQDCVSCHERTHFAPHRFDEAMHARTALPLDGRHAEQRCEACHEVRPPDSVRQFRGTPSRCESCHGDAHDDAFAAHRQRLAAHPRGACAQCHDTDAWTSLDHARFDHADWTGFGLDGAHAQIECTDCHARTDTPDALGRRFGRIPEHDGTDAAGDCARCHGDPHEGIFAREGAPQQIDGRGGCLRCHDTASFRALPHGFDHKAFAGFELTGKHGKLDCSACHQALDEATSTGRTWGKAKGRACADCHQDPHVGQFARFGKTDCHRCHKSANTFATLSFRHNLDSRFRLGEQHRKVACSLCHKPETKDGHTFVRYKPLPTKCVDCHGREEGGAPKRRRRRE